MANAIESFVNSYHLANEFIQAMRTGRSSLTELQETRERILTVLAEIAASPDLSQEVKDAATGMATDLRAEIKTWADSI